MIDVFRIGVHLGMTSNGPQVLGVLLRDLAKVEGASAAINKNFKDMKILAIGALGVVAGGAALRGLWDMVRAGEALNKELERTRQLGGDFANSLPQTRLRAFQVAGQVPTSSPSDNVKVLRELGTQLQNNDAARAILPMAQQAAYVIHNFTGEAVDDIIKNLVKVADIRAQIFSKDASGKEVVDPAKVQSEFDAASRGLILGGGYINSSALVTMARQGGVPAKTMTQEAFYAAMVEAAVSQGATRTGTATTSLFSQMVGGTMPVHVAEEMTRMGLMSQGEWRSDHGHIVMDPSVSARFQTALTDPMAFITGPLSEMMDKKGMSDSDKIAEVFKLFGRQTTQRLVAEGLSSEPQFARARSMFHQIPSVQDQYKELQARDLETNILSFTQAWKGLMQALGEQGIPVAIGLLHSLTDAIHWFTAKVVEHPEAARILLELSAGLALLMSLGGAMLVVSKLLSPFAAGMRLLVSALEGASAAAAGASALAAGLASVVSVLAGLGLIAKLGSDAETPENRKRLEDLSRQRRSLEGGPNGSLHDGFDEMGRPIPQKESYLTGISGGRVMQISTVVNLDGKRVGEIVSQHQARDDARPSSGLTGFDLRTMPMFPGQAFST